MKVKPMGDRILVEMLPAESMRGGLYLPDSAKETPAECIVTHLGTGKKDDEGNLIPFEVAVGDKILCNKYGGSEIKLGGKTYKVLRADEVIAVLS